MDIIKTIKQRKSCRTFNHAYLSLDDKKDLQDFFVKNRTGIDNETIDFKIIERYNTESPLKINYGMIQGHKIFVLGTCKSNPGSILNFGYLMEKVVLKATEMGLATCWVGYFDQTYFKEIIPEEGSVIPSILIIGYAEEKQSVGERLVRMTIKANKRNEWDKLFFNYQTNSPLNSNQTEEYNDSLEMVRLGPSAGNTQPWRIFFDETFKEFHFFKKTINRRYDELGLHEIDLGIAMAHFELTSLNKGLLGKWVKYSSEKIKAIDDLKYIISWSCNK